MNKKKFKFNLVFWGIFFWLWIFLTIVFIVQSIYKEENRLLYIIGASSTYAIAIGFQCLSRLEKLESKEKKERDIV